MTTSEPLLPVPADDPLDAAASAVVDGVATPEEAALVAATPEGEARVAALRAVSAAVGRPAAAQDPAAAARGLAAALAAFEGSRAGEAAGEAAGGAPLSSAVSTHDDSTPTADEHGAPGFAVPAPAPPRVGGLDQQPAGPDGPSPDHGAQPPASEAAAPASAAPAPEATAGSAPAPPGDPERARPAGATAAAAGSPAPAAVPVAGPEEATGATVATPPTGTSPAAAPTDIQGAEAPDAASVTAAAATGPASTPTDPETAEAPTGPVVQPETDPAPATSADPGPAAGPDGPPAGGEGGATVRTLPPPPTAARSARWLPRLGAVAAALVLLVGMAVLAVDLLGGRTDSSGPGNLAAPGGQTADGTSVTGAAGNVTPAGSPPPEAMAATPRPGSPPVFDGGSFGNETAVEAIALRAAAALDNPQLEPAAGAVADDVERCVSDGPTKVADDIGSPLYRTVGTFLGVPAVAVAYERAATPPRLLLVLARADCRLLERTPF